MRMHKIVTIAKRDYIATVRTKACVFGLVIAPMLFGGGSIAMSFFKGQPDLKDRRVAIVGKWAVDRERTNALTVEFVQPFSEALGFDVPVCLDGAHGFERNGCLIGRRCCHRAVEQVSECKRDHDASIFPTLAASFRHSSPASVWAQRNALSSFTDAIHEYM